MWTEQPLEIQLEKRLGSLPEPNGKELYADYTTARRYVIDEVARFIGNAEPDLTDHSATHLADVMARTHALIGTELEYFEPHELYLLAVSILFHDVGNLHGRAAHNKKIASIYGACRKHETRFLTERNAVLAIAGAHTGSSKDGSKDTLRDISRLSFQARSIRGQEVAAVLRFADELAEGPQRTSAYLLNHDMYELSSKIHHKYSGISDYCIDRDGGRIALTFNLDLEIDLTSGSLQVGQGILLEEILKFTYLRIVKVDQERRYCKHYCNLLSVFKETSACFTFYFQEQKLELGLAPILISDLIVPGEPSKQIEQIDGNYQVAALVSSLHAVCRGIS